MMQYFSSRAVARAALLMAARAGHLRTFAAEFCCEDESPGSLWTIGLHDFRLLRRRL